MPSTHQDRILLDRDDGVATVTLVREARFNAFDVPLHRALSDAFSQIERDPAIRAVVLTGRGGAFSAGQDLHERAAAFAAGRVPDIRGSLDELYNPLIRRITALPIPVIAAVNGAAFGAGASLAIACDIAFAARSAKFQFGFIQVGLGPDSGASWLLPRLVGLQRALDLALSGRPVTGEEAAGMGLVARCVPDAELLAEAGALARRIAAASPQAVVATKALLRAAAGRTLDQALEAERDAQAALAATDEYRDAVLRFAGRSRS